MSPKRKAAQETPEKWQVVDLFSGAGGMSCGFKRHGRFRIIAAVDNETAKPCEGSGSLCCNETYEENIGVKPFDLDMEKLDPSDFAQMLIAGLDGRARMVGRPTVLISCAPCTGYSRAKPTNHLQDDDKNGLVERSALFVKKLQPEFFVMENARELIRGNFSSHYIRLASLLEELGYAVSGAVYFLNRFGLPQVRERAVVIARRDSSAVYNLEQLWHGWEVKEEALTVRRAIGGFPPIVAGAPNRDDPMHCSPGFGAEEVRGRIEATPHDGGSWFDLANHPDAARLMTDSMKRRLLAQDFGSHPDVYGRLWWDRPAITVKRECAHVGNGRYAHPEQDRLLSVREMATLQGFPRDYKFVSPSLSNCYRQVGDAVPPLISSQIARLVEWMLTGKKPAITDCVLPLTSLESSDIVESVVPVPQTLF